jgi:hypothetical protein
MLILNPRATYPAVGLRLRIIEENRFRTGSCRFARGRNPSRLVRPKKTACARDRIDPGWEKSCVVRRRDAGNYRCCLGF